MLREDRALAGTRTFSSLVISDDHVRADDVRRHQVRRELNAGELQVHRFGKGAHEHGLAEAGHAFEQHVAAGEERDEHAFDDVLLADHHPPHFAMDPSENGFEMLDGSFERCGRGHAASSREGDRQCQAKVNHSGGRIASK